MADISFSVVRRIGVIAANRKNSLEFCLVKWNDSLPKYDLRRWGENGQIPYKGITFSKGEIEQVYNLLKKAKAKTKNTKPLKKVQLGQAEAVIYDDFGSFKSTSSMESRITFTSWGGTAKYDLRPWSHDYEKCGKGITLSENECDVFLSLIKSELGKSENDIYDTSSLDTDLLI